MELFEQLLHHLPIQWLLGVAVILLTLDRTGFVQFLFRRRREEVKKETEERISEREQLSEDTQALIARLNDSIEQERKYRLTDAEWYQAQIAALRKNIADREETIGKLVETARLSERGNARLRHGLSNVCQYIWSIRRVMRSGGLTPPPYEGWRDLLGLSDDLDEKITDLFTRLDNGETKPNG